MAHNIIVSSDGTGQRGGCSSTKSVPTSTSFTAPPAEALPAGGLAQPSRRRALLPGLRCRAAVRRQRERAMLFSPATPISPTARPRHRPTPFASLAEHDAALIRLWNETVGDGDEIWHLGDFARGGALRVETLLAGLNGRKHLIIGNNDAAPRPPPRAGPASVICRAGRRPEAGRARPLSVPHLEPNGQGRDQPARPFPRQAEAATAAVRRRRRCRGLRPTTLFALVRPRRRAAAG